MQTEKEKAELLRPLLEKITIGETTEITWRAPYSIVFDRSIIRHSGGVRTLPVMHARQESNLRPADSKSDALSS